MLGAALAVVASSHDASGVDRFRAGDEIPAGHGALIFHLAVPPPAKQFWKTLDWAVRLRRVDDDKSFTLPNANSPQVYLLPVGRYRFRDARTPEGDVAYGTSAEDAWFEVAEGRINYAGSWRLGGMWGTTGVSVSFDREPILVLKDRFAADVGRFGLWLAPLGQPARPLAAPAAPAPSAVPAVAPPTVAPVPPPR